MYISLYIYTYYIYQDLACEADIGGLVASNTISFERGPWCDRGPKCIPKRVGQ